MGPSRKTSCKPSKSSGRVRRPSQSSSSPGSCISSAAVMLSSVNSFRLNSSRKLSSDVSTIWPFVSTLAVGVLSYHEGGKTSSLALSGGFFEVSEDVVTVLADSALQAEQLDEQAARQAHQAAEEALKGATRKEDIEHAQAQLVEAAARYRAAQRLKGKRR